MTAAVGVGGLLATVVLARAARRSSVRDRVGPRPGPVRSWWFPAVARAWLAGRLDAAALPLTPEGAVQCWLAAVAAGTIVLGAFAPVLAPVGGLGVAVAGPVVLLGARRRADRVVAGALPDVLDHLAIDLRGGGTVLGALRSSRPAAEPLAVDLAAVVRRVDLGAEPAAALAAWVRVRPIAGVRAAAGALAMAHAVGGTAAPALEGLAASLRDRVAVRAEARALSTQARLSAVVVAVAPAGYLVVAAALDRDALDLLVRDPVGRICLAIGIALEVLAVLWMRWILRDEP